MSVARELSDEQALLITKLREVRMQSTALRDREAQLKEEIIAMLDGADLGCCRGADLVKIETTWRTTFNVKRFKADPMYGHLAEMFSKEVAVTSVRLP